MCTVYKPNGTCIHFLLFFKLACAFVKCFALLRINWHDIIIYIRNGWVTRSVVQRTTRRSCWSTSSIQESWQRETHCISKCSVRTICTIRSNDIIFGTNTHALSVWVFIAAYKLEKYLKWICLEIVLYFYATMSHMCSWGLMKILIVWIMLQSCKS